MYERDENPLKTVFHVPVLFPLVIPYCVNTALTEHNPRRDIPYQNISFASPSPE